MVIVALGLAAGCGGDSTEPNFAPFVAGSIPGEGEIIVVGPSEREVIATLGDHNLDDHLFIRILVDYPTAFAPPQSHLALQVEFPPSGTVIRAPVRFRPRCDFLGLVPGTHRLMMAVSDRPYLDAITGDSVDPTAPLDSIPEDGNRVRALWLLECPAP
jgi:hypothetical protein